MANSISDFRIPFSVTYRIKRNYYYTDPTNNGQYSSALAVQSKYWDEVYVDRQDRLVKIERFLVQLDPTSGESALGSYLALNFRPGVISAGLQSVELSAAVLQSDLQFILVDPSGLQVNERSRTAQNAGMSVEYILQRYASGQALPVMNRNSMSDSQRGLSEEDMKNIRVIENEMDAQQYVRDVRAAEAAQAAQSEMERPTDTPASGDADPAKDQ